MSWNNTQLADVESAVENLVKSTGFTEKEVIDILEDGFMMKYGGKLPDTHKELFDELRATFDAY